MLLVWVTPPLNAEDWRQFRGADRLAIWNETGIIEDFPDNGLKTVWRVPINSGFSGPAVSDGRVFVTDWREDPESRTMDGTERILALDENTGELLWSYEWGTTYRALLLSYAGGPMATPTVDGNRVYALGATGLLWCLDVESGEVVWHRNFLAEYDASLPPWGTPSAPLVDGERLITVVGGEPDALVVAFDKHTGNEIWRALEVAGGSSSHPIIYEAGGVRQLIIWHTAALASLNPDTGETYWEEPWEVGASMNVVTPVKVDNYLFVSQFYNGSLMMRLNTDRPEATLMWKGTSRSEMPGETEGLHAVITPPQIVDEHIYGVDSYGELRGLNAETGERLWMSPDMTPQARWGGAFIVQNGDRYFVNNDDGDLIIAKFTPQGYVEIDRTKLIDATYNAGFGPRKRHERLVNWAHPAYANRHILHRNVHEIIRVSLSAEDY
tara:strand:- start:4733 stop:6049 length:1317 start_codon:yes stop_codon:yes gene_type:complete